MAQNRWIDDVVEYFEELGGEVHLLDLYAYIKERPKRVLPASFDAIVRRTIEEHSSDTSIWSKRKLPDLFRSVDGIGKGLWALRDVRGADHEIAWSIVPGQVVDKDTIRAMYGGGSQGGIRPSRSSPNIMLFFGDEKAGKHGYSDGWKADGLFDYTGTGWYGDQTLRGFNGSVLRHARDQKHLRLFRGTGKTVVYIGEFELDKKTPYYTVSAPETKDGPLRSVIVFRLRPLDPEIVVASRAQPINSHLTVRQIELEEQRTETYSTKPFMESVTALRLESKLVQDLKMALAARGIVTKRHMISAPGQAQPLYTDM